MICDDSAKCLLMYQNGPRKERRGVKAVTRRLEADDITPVAHAHQENPFIYLCSKRFLDSHL